MKTESGGWLNIEKYLKKKIFRIVLFAIKLNLLQHTENFIGIYFILLRYVII